ncbi:MAG: RelA/SpoT domain-containing protein, partial [Roseiarcus sp.]|uniref:RelA/SpoT domain-containing protein n=1 Tax=Roseiarcus sp. TaxID=1969460 RepID=UPI003C232D18
LESIAAKLTRGQTKTLQLSQMQDIAGCRAVLSNVVNLSKVVAAYRRSHFSHILKSEKDYIANPKEDGYRGYHLVYQYQGLPGQINSYDKMRIEIQLRTELQHVWATAVEAVGTFTKQALKSNQGSKEWLRLFMLMSSYIALKEKCPTIKETPSDLEGLCAEIREISASIHAQQLLGAYKVTVQMAGKMSKSAKYFLVNYKFSDHVVSVTDFGATQSQAANDAYTKTEAGKNEGDNIVLVSVDSIKNLKRAYPNYFLDTTQFASLLTEAISYRARPAGKSRSS